jgi:hypothetical protein
VIPDADVLAAVAARGEAVSEVVRFVHEEPLYEGVRPDAAVTAAVAGAFRAAGRSFVADPRRSRSRPTSATSHGVCPPL